MESAPMVPMTTSNNLVDVINWLYSGYNVCIHTNTHARYFYNREGKESEKKRMIYVNVSRRASLFDDGEWEYYIKQSGYTQYPETIMPMTTYVDETVENFYFSLT